MHRIRNLVVLVAVGVLAIVGAAHAQGPSAFPERAFDARFGIGSSVAGALGVETDLEVPYVDAAAGLAVVLGADGGVGGRLHGTGLIFPTLGSPPVALGLGTDLTVRGGGTHLHLGVVAGFDLLFVSDVPAVVTAYLAPGVRFGAGASLAWSLEGRYYFDDIAIVVGSSDMLPVSVGVRVPF